MTAKRMRRSIPLVTSRGDVRIRVADLIARNAVKTFCGIAQRGRVG